jgi:hypothetical protein
VEAAEGHKREDLRCAGNMCWEGCAENKRVTEARCAGEHAFGRVEMKKRPQHLLDQGPSACWALPLALLLLLLRPREAPRQPPWLLGGR